MSIKGYKVFNPDWTCRGFKYEVGKTYKHEGNIKICGAGFHFCRKASDCFNYYDFNKNNKVAEVEALGLVETQNDKSVTNEIKILREIKWQEVLEIVNEGIGCTGLCNSGNRNSGNRNSGNWNAGNCNSGFFNTENHFFVFNKPYNGTREELMSYKGVHILNWNYENSWWICSQNMTEEEKKSHPEHKTTGGYLKTVDYKTACKMMWNNLTENEKEEVQKIPNFNKEIFKKITGIEE